MTLDLKPIAATMGIGSLVGGAIGGLFGGAPGLVAGANFAGSLGAQVGLYHKAEDLTDRAANAAGRKFEDISERLAQKALTRLDMLADRITNGIVKGLNLYTKMTITGYTANWALDLSNRVSFASVGYCSNEKEWIRCNAYSATSYLLLGVTAFSAFSLVWEIRKMKNKDFTNETTRPSTQTATNTSKSTEPMQKEKVSRTVKRDKPQETGLPKSVPIKC